MRRATLYVAGILIAGALSVAQTPAQSALVLRAEIDSTVRTDLSIRRNDNYGRDPRLIVGGTRESPFGGADGMRSLLRFDLSGISGGITSAILELNVLEVRGEAIRLDVHRIIDSGSLTPWIEGNGDESGTIAGAVGTDPSFGVAWSGAPDNPAPDALNNQTQPNFDPAPIASLLLDLSSIQAGDVVDVDVTDLARGWISGASPNFGITLVDSLSTAPTWSFVSFGSREGEQFNAGTIVGPRLVVVPVPEPSVVLLLAASLFALAVYRLGDDLASRESSFRRGRLC